MKKIIGIVSITIAAAVIYNYNAEESPQPLTSDSFRFSCDTSSAHELLISYESLGAYDPGKLNASLTGQGTQSVQSKASGEIIHQCEKLEQSTYRIHWVLKQFNLEYNQALILSQKDFERPLSFDVDAYGTIQQIELPENSDKIVTHVLRDILNHYTVNLDTPNLNQTFTTTELDVNGRYDADYDIDLDDSVLSITKERLSYHKRQVQTDHNLRTLVAPNSRSLYEINTKSKMITSVDSKLFLKFMNNDEEFGHTKTMMTISYQGPTTLSPIVVAQTQYKAKSSQSHTAQTQQNKTDLGASEEFTDIDKQMAKNSLGKDNWQTLSSKLDIDILDEEKTDIFVKLKSLLVLEPARARDVADKLIQEDPNSTAFQLMAVSMVAAGTPEAQKALISAIESTKGDQRKQIYLLGQSGLFESPVPELDSYLEKRIKTSDNPDVVSTSHLALANVAGNVKNSDPARHEKIAETYNEMIKSDDVATKNTGIMSAGNARSESSYDILVAQLNHPDQRTRTEAIRAIGNINTLKAENKLLSIMIGSYGQPMRKAAGEALIRRSQLTVATLDTMKSHYWSEKDISIRKSIINNISHRIPRDASLLDYLEMVLEKEKNKDIQGMVRNTLATNKRSS